MRQWDQEKTRHDKTDSKSSLMNKRIEMLRSLDFDFYVGKGKFSASSSKNSKDWELAFGKLLEYKAKTGHCNVPTKVRPNYHDEIGWFSFVRLCRSGRDTYSQSCKQDLLARAMGEYRDSNRDSMIRTVGLILPLTARHRR